MAVASATGAPAAAAAASITAEQEAMAAAFASFKGIPVDDVGALRAGSLHRAYDASTRSYWGTANFLPSAGAGTATAVKFQDGGGVGIFQSSNGTTWTMTRVGGLPFPCADEVPASVEAAWGLANSPDCARANPVAIPGSAASIASRSAAQSAATSSIADMATSQVGVGDTPASTNFGLDCDPYSTLVGDPATTAGCGVDPHFDVRNENEFWCADFAKYVWVRGGVRTNLGTLNAGANSFYKWGAEAGERLIPDANNPAVGDAVVFYPPGDLTPSGITFADHVAIVVGINPNGTVNLVNGDFGGTTNISVQLFNDVSIASWASFMFNTGEQFVYVSPGGSLSGGAGVPSGTPAALANSASWMNVFYRSQGGQITAEYWTAATGWALVTLPGGDAAGDPAAVANSSSMMNVWYTTQGGRVANDYWLADLGWINQTLPGGDAVGDVAAVDNSSSLMNVFFTTSQGRIGADYWTPQTGWRYQTLPGGNAASAPTVVASGSTWMNLWYTTTRGGIAQDYWTPSTGWVYQTLPGSDATGAPSAVMNSSTWMNVFYTNLDGQVYADYWTPSTGWRNQPLPSAEATGVPNGVVISLTSMNVWYTTNDGQLDDIFWTPTAGWMVQGLPSFALSGSPRPLVHSTSWINVFYTTLNGRIGAGTWLLTDGWTDQLLPL